MHSRANARLGHVEGTRHFAAVAGHCVDDLLFSCSAGGTEAKHVVASFKYVFLLSPKSPLECEARFVRARGPLAKDCLPEFRVGTFAPGCTVAQSCRNKLICVKASPRVHFSASPDRDLLCVCVGVLHFLHLTIRSHLLLCLNSTKRLACRSLVLFQLGAAHAVSAASFFTQQVCKDLLSVEWGRV